MKKTLLLIVLVASASLLKVNAQTEVLLWSDDFSSTDFYTEIGVDLTTVSDTFNVAATDGVALASLQTDDTQGNYASVTNTDNGGGKNWYFKIGTGPTINGCENGSYVVRAKVRALGGKTLKLNIFSAVDENLVIGQTNSGDWTEIETTFDITTLGDGEKDYPVIVFATWALQDFDVDDIQVFKIDTGTKIRKVADEGAVSIYPNPANTTVNINSSADVQKIEIVDFTGKTAMVVENANNRLDVSGLERGVYLMRVTSNDGVKVVKLVKK